MLQKLFVIIVTYKGHQWYERCFTSLRNSEYPVQTIVIDNASNDGTVEYIRENFPEIHLIESTENLGFGRANNIGMRYALDNECDYVFLLNQDAWLDSPDTLKKLVDIYNNHPEYGILSPMHLNVNKSKLMMEQFSAQPINGKLISDLYLQSLDDVYETTYIHAAAWLLNRKILLDIGGFDPIFFHYGEDDNYLNRAIYHGFKIGICPSTRIVHDHRDSISYNKKLRNQELITLLVDWTNINKKFSAVKLVLYYARKWLLFCFDGKFALSKKIYYDMRYCISMKKAINYSRTENIQVKSSWL